MGTSFHLFDSLTFQGPYCCSGLPFDIFLTLPNQRVRRSHCFLSDFPSFRQLLILSKFGFKSWFSTSVSSPSAFSFYPCGNGSPPPPPPRRYWWPVISGALLILSFSVRWPTTSCFYLLLQTMHSFLSLYLGTFGRLRYLPNSTFFVWGLCTVPCVWRPSLWCCECSYLNGDCFPFRQRCTCWASKV